MRNGERLRVAGDGGRAAGFTLLELIVVIAIIGILATIVMPALKDMPRRAQEAVLKTDLTTMRGAIDQYYGDKGRYPSSLETLAEKGYLKKVPVDPLTKSSETWVLTLEEETEEEESSDADEESGPGIVDVHSGSTRTSLLGTPYAEW